MAIVLDAPVVKLNYVLLEIPCMEWQGETQALTRKIELESGAATCYTLGLVIYSSDPTAMIEQIRHPPCKISWGSVPCAMAPRSSVSGHFYFSRVTHDCGGGHPSVQWKRSVCHAECFEYTCVRAL